MSKPLFQLVFVAFAAYFLACGAVGLRRLHAAGRFGAPLARLTVLATRAGGAAAPAARNVSRFGLLRDGCKLPPPPEGVLFAGASLIIRSDAAVEANGYFFATAAVGDGGGDPARWVVEVSGDGGESWRAVGASVWRWAADVWVLDEDGVELYPQADHMRV